MKAEIMNITPKMAAKMLERNPYNRNLSQRTVNIYAEAMRRNEWHSNGESISFDEEGNLINGQHRLAACIKANTPFCCTVVTGVLKQDSYLFDKGRGRTIASTIAIAQAHGEMDGDKIYTSNAMLAVAKYIISIADYRARTGNENGWNNRDMTSITPERLYKYMQKHKAAFEWLHLKSNRFKKRIRTASVNAALLQAYESGYPAELLESFCEALATGLMKTQLDGIVIKLREKITDRIGGDTAEVRRDIFLSVQYALKAYESGKVRARIAAKDEYYKGAYPDE